MLLDAVLAGQAVANAPVAAVHALAYPLDVSFHVLHGLSNALVPSRMLRFNASAAADLYAELAGIVLPRVEGPVQARVDAFIVWCIGLTRMLSIAMPTA